MIGSTTRSPRKTKDQRCVDFSNSKFSEPTSDTLAVFFVTLPCSSSEYHLSNGIFSADVDMEAGLARQLPLQPPRRIKTL
jgi:hypothetical protein